MFRRCRNQLKLLTSFLFIYRFFVGKACPFFVRGQVFSVFFFPKKLLKLHNTLQ